jgi:hypothetical protein
MRAGILQGAKQWFCDNRDDVSKAVFATCNTLSVFYALLVSTGSLCRVKILQDFCITLFVT